MPPWLDAGRLCSAALDLRGAQTLNRAASRPLLTRVSSASCSRFADGPLWVVLLLLLPASDVVFGAPIGMATSSLIL